MEKSKIEWCDATVNMWWGCTKVSPGCAHWIIAGGESGPGARPMHPEWARGLRDQCQAARVPFLFKQWGDWAPMPSGGLGHVGKKLAGRQLDGREWNEFPAAMV